ncbi:hypothetical protein UlMin_025778, partial [Ulmus minor]
MSSHDSTSMVVKCFSKGAVDFLVKPIRKNELKNLWQHVWRKYQINYNYKYESNNRGRKLTAEILQSSWTKRAADADSPKPMSPDDQFADPCDSACAQVIHPRHKAFGKNGLSESAIREPVEQDDEFEIPFFEMLLKRPRDVQDTESSAQDRTVLRHSDLSTFSRDNSASSANQAPAGNVGSCSLLDNSSDAKRKESAPNFQSDSQGTPPNQRSNGSSNNNDLESTTNDASTKQVAFDECRMVKLFSSLQYKCGSSNILRASLEGNVGNQSLKGSSSGSKNGSNEHNLSTNSLNSRGKKILMDENQFEQREAALKRFRQKRQERCFEKK